MNPSKHPRSRYSTSNNLPQAFLKRNSYAIQYESPTIQTLTLATNHLLETQIEDPTSTIQPRTTLYSDDQNIPKGAAQPSMTTPNDQRSRKSTTHQKYRETLPSRQGYFRKHSSEAQRHSSSGWETDERQAARRRPNRRSIEWWPRNLWRKPLKKQQYCVSDRDTLQFQIAQIKLCYMHC